MNRIITNAWSRKNIYVSIRQGKMFTLLYLSLFVLLITESANGQVSLQPQTNMVIQQGTIVDLDEGIETQPGSFLSVSGSLSVQTDLENRSSMSFQPGSELIFNGTSPQTISGNAFIVPKLVVDNSNGVSLHAPLTITSELNMQNGLLFTDLQSPVYFSASASNPTESGNSYISGYAIMNSRSIGSSGMNTFLGLSMSPGVDIGTLSIIRHTGSDAIVPVNSSPSIASSWELITSETPGNNNRLISFYWLNDHDNGRDMSAINLFGSTSSAYYDKLSPNSQDVSSTNPRHFVQYGGNVFNRHLVFSGLNSPTSVATPDLNNRTLTAYPNPFTERFFIHLSRQDIESVEIIMSDISGREVLRNTVKAGQDAIVEIRTTDDIKEGIYLLNIRNHNFSENIKLIKTH